MKGDIEISRFSYEGIDYILGAYIWERGNKKIPSPWIMITTKSSKKNRPKSYADKYDNHFRRMKIKQPIGLYRRVIRDFHIFLNDYDYVHFMAHSDDKNKRERVYQKALERMGFNLAYIYKNKLEREFLMIREGVKYKKKEIKKLLQDIGEADI